MRPTARCSGVTTTSAVSLYSPIVMTVVGKSAADAAETMRTPAIARARNSFLIMVTNPSMSNVRAADT